MKFVALTYFVPWSRYLPFDAVKFKASVKSSKLLKNYFRKNINENKGKTEPGKFSSFAEVYSEELRKSETHMDLPTMGKNQS